MTHIGWNKFFTGPTDPGDHGDENETDTEDEEEITDSNATVSTDKRPYFLGIGFHRFTYSRFSERCVKYVFIMLNSATFLAGLIGSVITVWTLTDHVIMSRLIGQRFYVTALLFMSLIASFVSLVGLFGLLRKRESLLNIYACCYLLFLSVIFITAILGFWIFEEIVRRIRGDMIFSMQNYNSTYSCKEAWNNTHRYLKCCGINSSKDWAQYDIDIPKSCCSTIIDECLQMTEEVSYKSGCLKCAVFLLKSYVPAISTALVLIFLITLLNFFLALCLLARLKITYPHRN